MNKHEEHLQTFTIKCCVVMRSLAF